MPIKWVVVANRIEARIFNAEDMRPLIKLKNSLGREKNKTFTTDRPDTGRRRGGGKSSTHNMSGEAISPHDDVAKVFARKIGLYLAKRKNEHLFESLLIVAEPRMMGWIKADLSKGVAAVCEWKGKDLGHQSDHELRILFLGKEAVWPSPRSSF